MEHGKLQRFLSAGDFIPVVPLLGLIFGYAYDIFDDLKCMEPRMENFKNNIADRNDRINGVIGFLANASVVLVINLSLENGRLQLLTCYGDNESILQDPNVRWLHAFDLVHLIDSDDNSECIDSWGKNRFSYPELLADICLRHGMCYFGVVGNFKFAFSIAMRLRDNMRFCS